MVGALRVLLGSAATSEARRSPAVRPVLKVSPRPGGGGRRISTRSAREASRGWPAGCRVRRKARGAGWLAGDAQPQGAAGRGRGDRRERQLRPGCPSPPPRRLRASSRWRRRAQLTRTARHQVRYSFPPVEDPFDPAPAAADHSLLLSPRQLPEPGCRCPRARARRVLGQLRRGALRGRGRHSPARRGRARVRRAGAVHDSAVTDGPRAALERRLRAPRRPRAVRPIRTRPRRSARRPGSQRRARR